MGRSLAAVWKFAHALLEKETLNEADLPVADRQDPARSRAIGEAAPAVAVALHANPTFCTNDKHYLHKNRTITVHTAYHRKLSLSFPQ